MSAVHGAAFAEEGGSRRPESKSEAKPERKRGPMSAAQKKAVSERMTVYWAERRKKARKK